MYVFKKLYSMLTAQNNSNRNDNIADHHTPPRAVEEDDDMDEEIKNPLFVDAIEVLIVPDQLENRGILDSVPTIYVDAKVLEQVFELGSNTEVGKREFGNEINGTTFLENDARLDELLKKDDKFFEFKIIDNLSDLNSDDDEEKQLQTDTSEFPIEVQNTPYGLIINSNVLLSENGWNTIVCGDDTACLACDKILDIRDISEHIADDDHKNILDKVKPLKEFDINIVRKMNDKYHCAICNITFDIDDTEHLESVTHGQKLLTSINKVSDITQTDFNDIGHNENKNSGNDCININAIVEDSSGFDSESFDGFYDDASVTYYNELETEAIDFNQQTNQNFSYADIAKKPKEFALGQYVHIKLDDKYAKVTFDSWHMIITLDTNNFYCMACKESGAMRHKSNHCLTLIHVEKLMKCVLVRDYKDYVVREVDDKLYHCGHCNNLKMIHEIKKHLESMHMKKNVLATINIAETTQLNKNVSTTAASSSSKETNIDHVITYNAPSSSAESSPIVANYYSKTGNIANENNVIPTPNAAVQLNNQSLTTPNVLVNPIHNNATDSRVNHMLNPPTFHIVPFNQAYSIHCARNVSIEKNEIVITEFGQFFKLNILAYHMIQHRGPNMYHCLVCDLWCMNDVFHHTSDPLHLKRIKNAGFLPQTKFHLIRHSKYGFHCMFCNILLKINPIHHTWDPLHLTLVHRALCLPPMSNVPTGQPIYYQHPTSIITNANRSETNTNEKEDEKTKPNLENIDNGKCDSVNNEITVTEINEDNDFDTEEYLYVKVKNNYTKITMTSYNCLVQNGNGARYCALCCENVFLNDLKVHVSSEKHLLNMKRCTFLEKYERHLFRQMSTCYHCALCNVCVHKNYLSQHIAWPNHKEAEASKIVKNTRRNEVKSGTKEINCSTQKEIVANDMTVESKILSNIEFKQHAQQDIVKKKKIVTIDGVVLKLSWDAFHGIWKSKKGYTCLICKCDFKSNELSAHTESLRHVQVLENRFRLEFSPALIRKVNHSSLHCVTCNVEVTPVDTITDHIESRRHVKKFLATVADRTDTEISSDNDILVLKSESSKNKK